MFEIPSCNCFKSSRVSAIHSEKQDTDCDAWHRLLELIDHAAASQATEFAPGSEIGWPMWSQVVTLPSSIAKLSSLKRLYLYRNNLSRIPPEIGELKSLEELDLYMGYRLHWLPFEITRCTRLNTSRISTRALYGNYKFRHHFPMLYDNFDSLPTHTPMTCSICDGPFGSIIKRRWITLKVATDVLPLLVNACSQECIDSLPSPPDNYLPTPHSGGSHIEQPPPR